MSLSYIPPKCAKTREPKDQHCVSWCTYKGYYICTPIPLDNHTALPYITWGLIWDLKSETERSQLTNFTRMSSGISKIKVQKRGEFPCEQAADKQRKKENPSCQIHLGNSF